jgi:hypothetical protein
MQKRTGIDISNDWVVGNWLAGDSKGFQHSRYPWANPPSGRSLGEWATTAIMQIQ